MALLIQLQSDKAGVKYRIDSKRFTIGRGDMNDLCLDDDLVSKSHAVIEVVPRADDPLMHDYLLQDLGSTNHTYANEERIEVRKLQHEDTIRIGMNSFKFIDDENDRLDETTRLHKTWIPGVYLKKKKPKKK